jgi:hypothetical protein
MRLSLAALALALVAASPHATADILGGWIGPPGTTAANVISAFDDEADGNVAPAYLIGGPATGLETANGMSYSSDDGTLLVADFYGQQVKVFAPGTVGDSPPLRTFSHGSILQPLMAVALPGHDEIAVVNFAFIQYYPRDADGTVAPLRSTAYAPGLLDNLSSLVYLPAFDQVAVGDGYTAGGGGSAGEVLLFDRTAAGTTPPARRIAGPLTRLGAFVVGLAHDPVNAELFVLAANADGTASIQVFEDDASGDVAPIRSIEGAATAMANVGSLAYYPLRDQLLVASGAYNDVPRLLAFPRLASGNVAPERTISGPATGVGSPNGWTGVVGVPPVQLFRHGFE